MKKQLSQIWQQFRATFFAEEINPNVETGKIVLETAILLKEEYNPLEDFKLLVQNSSCLLDVLYLPLTEVVKAEISFISLAVALLKFYRDISYQEPILEDYVSVICQAAYLESTRDILSLYPYLNYQHQSESAQLDKILHHINELELDEQIAINIIECFHNSQLANIFNQFLSTRLISPNLTQYPANLLAKRIAANTHKYLIKAWKELVPEINQIIPEFYHKLIQLEEHEASISEYLNNQIATQGLEKVLDNTCTLKDIYIPLKIKPVNKFGKVDSNSQSIELETWVKKNLLTNDKLSEVMFIQGKTGSGKSIFCKIFSDWVRQHLYPLWIPIIINCRDITCLGTNLETTIKANLNLSFIEDDENWLKNQNHHFIIIFDGWEDLHIVNSNHIYKENYLTTLINQVAKFQQECKNNPDFSHRIIITGNHIPLSTIPQLPENLMRVEILPFDNEQRENWLKKWQSLPNNQGKNTNLKEFLQTQKCPAIIEQLSYEPFLLYFLAGMYKDGQLEIDNILADNSKTARSLIYQQAINWLITQKNHDLELSDLQDLLVTSAIAVVHSGGKLASKSMILSRLDDDKKLVEIVNNDHIKTLLRQFDCDSSVTFHHHSLSQFLFAKKLQDSFIKWTEYEEIEKEKKLIISNSQMNWQIYDLLSFGGLKQEIVDYLIGLIISMPNFQWIQLYRRLHNFYIDWCAGKFIDSCDENLAQRKQQQLQKFGIYEIGQRQVDIFAGLNVMILLLGLQHYAQEHEVLKEHIIFYPSGEPTEHGLTYQLQNIIHYSYCLKNENFLDLVGEYFCGVHLRSTNLQNVNFCCANLAEADLSRANLSGGNLRFANLHSAYFIGTNLQKADLTGANLGETYFSGANLSGASLCSTNLQDVDMSRANLSGADLRGANLEGANFMGANFKDDVFGEVIWDKSTNWANVDGLDMAKNVPVALRKLFL